jgi:ribosomal protein S18 acetylase RimI-like enzyme
MTTRLISPDDLYRLRDISERTFRDTFAEGNTEANLNKYLAEKFSLEVLAAELANPDSRFYFAELDEEPIGYLKLNFGKAQTEIRDEDGVEIERIYVVKEYLGARVGQLLYEKALKVATEAHARFIWLGVWEENKRAIRFYEKNGFIEFDRHIFVLGDDHQTDIMMKLDLQKGK